MSMYPAEAHLKKTLITLVGLLPEADREKPQIIVITGEVTPFRNDTDREIVFRQESNFYYLTGCSVPSSAVIASFNFKIPGAPQHVLAQPFNGPKITPKPNLRSYLCIPPIEPADLMWSVPPPTLSQARFTHDATIEHTTEAASVLSGLLEANPTALVHILPQTAVFPSLATIPTLAAFLEKKATPLHDEYLLKALHHARLTKDAAEIEAIRKANAISSRAHEVIMRLLGKGVRGTIKRESADTSRPLLPGEWLIEKEAEAEAVFVASCRREGAVHQAYMPIVASSTRAATLHYCCNDREFAWGPGVGNGHGNGRASHDHLDLQQTQHVLDPQVLLIDAGCEWDCYASDITRTMPVGNGGKFTPEAREIYSLVLEMQNLSMAALKPGVHWDDIQLLCHRTLIKGFLRLGLFVSSTGKTGKEAEEELLASSISAAFFPHGVGHSLGMDVHDVPSVSKPPMEENSTIPEASKKPEHEGFYKYLRLRVPLQENMVVTVEPGIYFHLHLLTPIRKSTLVNHELLATYEDVGGVRIEDVVLITASGYENLTTVGRDVEWVERVCSGED